MWTILPRLATIFGTAWAGAYMAKSDEFDTKNGVTDWYNSLPLIMRTTMWVVLVGVVFTLMSKKMKRSY